MANYKITELTELATTPATDDVLPIVDVSAPATTKKITVANLLSTVVALEGNQTVNGVKTFNSFPVSPSAAPTTDYQIANKKYVDDNSLGALPNMSLIARGAGEEATQAEIEAGTQLGATGAELVVNPKYLKDSIYFTQLPTSVQAAALAGTGSPSGSNKYVTKDTNDLNQVISNLDTTAVLGTSDTKYPSQKAVKTYVDNNKTTTARSHGTITKDMTEASGAVNTAHGLGVTPKKVRLTAVLIGANSDYLIICHGVYDAGGQHCIYSYQTSAVHFGTGSDVTHAILLIPNEGNYQSGIVSVDATNITITWTKSGSPSGSAEILWEAEYASN